MAMLKKDCWNSRKKLRKQTKSDEAKIKRTHAGEHGPGFLPYVI